MQTQSTIAAGLERLAVLEEAAASRARELEVARREMVAANAPPQSPLKAPRLGGDLPIVATPIANAAPPGLPVPVAETLTTVEEEASAIRTPEPEASKQNRMTGKIVEGLSSIGGVMNRLTPRRLRGAPAMQ